ncbi:MAG: ATP-binding protein [Bacteroidota bacterium]
MKIAVTGPESTGKSTLAEGLAKHFRTTWVPEYARSYIDKIERTYNYQDILKIAKGQIREEDNSLQSADHLMFCDTELIVTKIWCEVKYGKCHPWILNRIKRSHYDLFLLCDIDLPWQEDPQREHPDMREYLFKRYLDEITYYQFPFAIISGIGDERLVSASKVVADKFNL